MFNFLQLFQNIDVICYSSSIDTYVKAVIAVITLTFILSHSSLSLAITKPSQHLFKAPYLWLK